MIMDVIIALLLGRTFSVTSIPLLLDPSVWPVTLLGCSRLIFLLGIWLASIGKPILPTPSSVFTRVILLCGLIVLSIRDGILNMSLSYE